MSDVSGSLDQLNDIVEPSLGFFPLAPGMIGLLLIALVMVMLFVHYWWARYKAQAYRKEGLRLLKSYQAQQQHNHHGVLKLPVLMKRVAISAYGADTVAALSGDVWWEFLNRTLNSSKANNSHLNQTDAQLLVQLPYQPALAEKLTNRQVNAIYQFCQHWIQHHQVNKPC